MLHLIVQIDGEAYAVESAQIVEVLPLARVKRTTGCLATMMLRGALTPVIDLAQLVAGRPSRPRLGARIVLVRTPSGNLAGLLAEHATQTLRIEPNTFIAAGVEAGGSAVAPAVALCDRRLIRRLQLERVFTAAFGDSHGQEAA